MSEPANREKLRRLLHELLQVDRADLDFGIYRILNQRREEIGRFLDDLLRERELEDVFSHLHHFFGRYYSEGDFMPLRRYKEGTYGVPYEGEDVKLHWAHADQYYVKSTESFRDYTFKLADGRRVHLGLVAASTEEPAHAKERRFVFLGPLREEKGELVVPFEYRRSEEKQKTLDERAVASILGAKGFERWTRELGRAPEDEKRSLIERHVARFTARNTFDYFIHKRLGEFLRRELDFYIKNEVMHLDDIESESAPRVEQYLGRIRTIRALAGKVIRFLEQLEELQKKLWLKRKFVLETSYCLTLDRVPRALYPEIAENEAQREEWARLGCVSTPVTVELLEARPFLVVDTKHFAREFTDRLLEGLDLEESFEGTLIHAENFQALSLMQTRYAGAVTAIYVDPPYNTDASAILYKNDYKDSSWLSLMHDRLQLAAPLLREKGVICAAIDDAEVVHLRHLLGTIFCKEIGVAVVRSNPQSRKTRGKLSPVHEYALFFGRSNESVPGTLDATEKKLARYPLEDSLGRYAWMNFIRTGNNDRREDRPRLHYPIYVSQDDRIRIPGLEWSEEKREYLVLEKPARGESVVYPVSDGIEKNWHRGHERVTSEPEDYRVRRAKERVAIDFKTRMDEEAAPTTWWDRGEYASSNHGAAELKELFGAKPFDFPKAQDLVRDCLCAAGGGEPGALVLDFFAGSGTTAHALIDMSRHDGERRRYVLVEAGEHMRDVIVPRIKKAVFSATWKEGRPRGPGSGVGHGFRYVRLESYEDVLDNLQLKRTEAQSRVLESHAGFREDYLLSYMLDVESRGSFLDLEGLRKPDRYVTRVVRDGERVLARVDLVETFNWLLGLTVKRVRVVDGVRVVEGTSPEGERVLVLWRDQDEIDGEALARCFAKARPADLDLVYVNGENGLEKLRRADETWRVRLVELELGRLMFEGNAG